MRQERVSVHPEMCTFIPATCFKSHHMLLRVELGEQDFTEEITTEIPECAENTKPGAAHFTFQIKKKTKNKQKTLMH